MIRLLLPLHCFDDAGRVKPPRFFWWCCLFLCKSLFILVVSLTLRTDGDFLLSFFYPVRSQFVLGSLIGLGPLVAMLLVSFREKWWQGRWQHLARLIKPLIFVSLCADMVHQLSLASQHYWQFSWSVATFVIIDAVCVYWLITSHHLKVMINDWRN